MVNSHHPLPLSVLVPLLHHAHAMGHGEQLEFGLHCTGVHRELWSRWLRLRARNETPRDFHKFLGKFLPGDLVEEVWHAGIQHRLDHGPLQPRPYGVLSQDFLHVPVRHAH